MSRPVRFIGKFYNPIAPTKPEQIGPAPGTVEWELNQRKLRKEQREAELYLASMESIMHERESSSIWHSLFCRLYVKR